MERSSTSQSAQVRDLIFWIGTGLSLYLALSGILKHGYREGVRDLDNVNDALVRARIEIFRLNRELEYARKESTAISNPDSEVARESVERDSTDQTPKTE